MLAQLTYFALGDRSVGLGSPGILWWTTKTSQFGNALPWFDPQSIKTGFVGGERGSHQPSIWIDAEKGIFYYHYSD